MKLKNSSKSTTLKLKQEVRLKWHNFVVLGASKRFSVKIKDVNSSTILNVPLILKAFNKSRYKKGMYVNPLICGLHTPVPKEVDVYGNDYSYHTEYRGGRYYILIAHDFDKSGIYYLDNAYESCLARPGKMNTITTVVRRDNSQLNLLIKCQAEYKEDILPDIMKLLNVPFQGSVIQGKILRIISNDKHVKESTSEEDIIVLTDGKDSEISLPAKYLQPK